MASRAGRKRSSARGSKSGSRGTSSRSSSRKTTARKSASKSSTSRTSRRTSSRANSKSNRSATSSRNRSNAKSHYLTDHDEIRQWAEERDATPACVRGTGRSKGDTGMIRLDFPGYSGAKSLKPIEWDDWFESFDDNNLALVVQDSTARGQRSNFNKIVGRETISGRKQGSHASRRHPERDRKAGNVKSISNVSGSRAQTKSTRGSTRGARTASARGQNRSSERRAA